MILIDLEDVQRVSALWKYEQEAFIHPELTPEEDWEAMNDPQWFDKHPEKRYYPGPYLLRVNNEEAWLSRRGDHWQLAARRMRYPSVAQQKWMAYLELYAADIGISSRTLLNRFAGMQRRLKKDPGVWYDWEMIYTWIDGSEQVWDGLHKHPYLDTQEPEGRKAVRYVQT